jgi:hypothetical protein
MFVLSQTLTSVEHVSALAQNPLTSALWIGWGHPRRLSHHVESRCPLQTSAISGVLGRMLPSRDLIG